MRFFFYGTLLDSDLRRFVLGARAPTTVEPATLAGWERVPVRDAVLPIIRRRAGAAVEGMLARGLDAEAARLLVEYESGGYDLVAVEVALADGGRRSARVFAAIPGGPLAPASGAWRFDEWERRHKAAFLAAIRGGVRAPRS